MKNDILVKLRLAGEEFSREFKQAFDQAKVDAEQAGADTTDAYARGISARKASLIAAVGAAGVAAVQGIRQSLELAGDLDAASKQIGVNVEELQKYRFAASKAGLSTEQLDSNIAELTLTIGEANAGNRQAQQSFVDLGVGFQTTTGQARSTEAVLVDVAQRLVDIDDPSERARLGTQLLGEEFYRLEPLLAEAATGFRATTAELSQFGGVLSQEEIQNLNATNDKIERMKTVLSIRVASIVAENAEHISYLTNELAGLAAQALQTTGAWLQMRNALTDRANYQAKISDYLDSNYSGASASERSNAEKIAMQRYDARKGIRRNTESYMGGLFKTHEYDVRRDGNYDDFSYYTDYNRAQVRAAIARGGKLPGVAAPPRVSGGGGGGVSRGSSPRRSTSRQSTADRERERAAKEAQRAEEQFAQSIERTIQRQEDSARVEQIRADIGDVAAATEEARLDFLRQNPLAAADTVEQLKAMLGITTALTEADEKRLQLLIDQGDVAERGVLDAAFKTADAEDKRKKAQEKKESDAEAKRIAEKLEREHEAAIRDVADIYEDLFTNGVDSVWDHFKQEGLRIVAEIAAQWTLALIAGQKFDVSSAAGDALGRSPLASLFGVAANDNQSNGRSVGTGAGVGSGIGGVFDKETQEIIVSASNPSAVGVGATAGPSPLGLYAAGVAIADFIGTGIEKATGLEYSRTGGMFGGLIGGFLVGALKSTKRGSATIGSTGGGLGVTGSRGNSSSRESASTGNAGSVIDTIYRIADAVGGNVDASRGSVSIGLRKDNFRVDTTGRGITKTKNGAIDFGQDQEAAIAFAVQDLLRDGVLTGISRASQNILQAGKDLEQSIEKVVLIESVPRLLKERLDPLGASLDALYDRFKKLSDALKEGGASAEQIADARQLWELEKADAIASIGSASAELKDFLLSLNAGSNSPLSLRQQREEAEAALAPYEAQIAEAQAALAEVERLKTAGASEADIAAAEQAARIAAAAIDQSGFADASQLLLSIDRGINASGAGFFETFERIRTLTGSAIGLIDGAQSPTDIRDPFTELTATNTTDIVNLMVDTNNLLKAINDNIRDGGGFGAGGRSFFDEPRAFAR